MSVATQPALFRFDPVLHEYLDLHTGAVLPHITGLLEQAGWIDSTWFTEASCKRGTAVHSLCTEYDLGALEDVVGCTSAYKGWLQAYVEALKQLRPTMLAVEEPLVSARYHFGGRPDRVVVLWGLKAVLEIKSGPPEKAHPIQTAMQAILVAPEHRLPPETFARFALYLKQTGKYKLEEHRNRRDFDEAYKIIRTCAA